MSSAPEERVTSFDWNIEIAKRRSSIFEKNTPFPTSKKIPIRTAFNNQISIEFQIFKGTDPYNWYILEMSPTKRRTKIEIFCKIDENEDFLVEGNIKKVGSIDEHYKSLLSEGKYYEIIGIDENAPQRDVNDAFTDKSSRFKSSKINQMINTAHENIKTEDKRKRMYLKNAITDIFREWEIDEQYYGNISYFVKEFMKSTDSYWSLKENGRGYIKNKILKKEKPAPMNIQVGGKDYVVITRDEGKEGIKYPLTRKNLITGEEESFEISIPLNTSSDVDVISGGDGNPHAYIPDLKGDAILKVKVIPIDANEIIEKIKEELKTSFTYSEREQKDIVTEIRGEVHRQYDISEKADVIEGIIVNEFVTNIRQNALPISLTKDEAKEGINIPLKTKTDSIHAKIPSYSKDGDMIHVKGLEFVEVKEIPANANAIFKKIKKELKTGFKYSERKQKDIVKVIRGEVHRQYHESGLEGIGMRSEAAEEEFARKIMENRERYHRSGCAGVNEKKIINNIISIILPPPIRFDITLKEAIFGCQKRGTLVNQKCEMCGGTGYKMVEVEKPMNSGGVAPYNNKVFDKIMNEPSLSNLIKNNPALINEIMKKKMTIKEKCSCVREINVEVPSIKTLFLNHIIPIEDGQILVKSQIRRILGLG